MIRFINIISICLVIILFVLNLLYLKYGTSPIDFITTLFDDENTDQVPTRVISEDENPTYDRVTVTDKIVPAIINEEHMLLQGEKNNIDVFHKSRSSVVHVTNNVLYQNYFTLDVASVPQGTGTGIIWDKTGLIITNYHVVANAGQVIIKLIDRSTYVAKIIGLEPGKDLAVLKIDAPTDKLKPANIGDSANLEVGRKVMAIGNPFGLDYTLTVGVISALGREIKSPTNMTITGVIQTDAAINPGNSGGPLLNSSGELIGINTQIVSLSGASSGIGFAIPVNAIKKIMPMLIQYGKIIRPDIGVTLLDDNTSRYYNISGAVIREVIKNSPAYDAGLEGIKFSNNQFYLGDIIVEIENVKIKNTDNLFLELEKYKVNDTVTIKVKRDNKLFSVNLKLGTPR